jgi:ParB family chromosome partitioning protein
MSAKTQQKNKPRLGRGLSSLISMPDLPVQIELPAAPAPVVADDALDASAAPPPPTTSDGGAIELPIAAIMPNPHQPRQDFNQSALAELAASIKSTGLIQPILVRKAGDGYQLVAGERRLRAARLAGLINIPALLRDVDSATQAQMALIENIQRSDLNPIERAQGYSTLIDQLGLTQVELAGRLGEDRSSIANHLRLLELTPAVQSMVRDGRLTLGHAKLIASVADILEQERLANLVISQGLSVRNLERIIQGAGPTPPPARTPDHAPSPHIQDLEKSISRQLGLRVQLRSGAKKGRGKIIIHYGNLDQFDDLLERLGVKTD